MFWVDKVLVYEVDGVKVDIIVGEFEGYKVLVFVLDFWVVDFVNEVVIWIIKLLVGKIFIFLVVSVGFNCFFYFYQGNLVSVDGQDIFVQKIIDLYSDQFMILIVGIEDVYFLFLQGKLINELVVQYGLFVANDWEGIIQIMQEYQVIEFGGWLWLCFDQVYEWLCGCFVRYVDGWVEEKVQCGFWEIFVWNLINYGWENIGLVVFGILQCFVVVLVD